VGFLGFVGVDGGEEDGDCAGELDGGDELSAACSGGLHRGERVRDFGAREPERECLDCDRVADRDRAEGVCRVGEVFEDFRAFGRWWIKDDAADGVVCREFGLCGDGGDRVWGVVVIVRVWHVGLRSYGGAHGGAHGCGDVEGWLGGSGGVGVGWVLRDLGECAERGVGFVRTVRADARGDEQYVGRPCLPHPWNTWLGQGTQRRGRADGWVPCSVLL
jgi:hypothetical protein